MKMTSRAILSAMISLSVQANGTSFIDDEVDQLVKRKKDYSPNGWGKKKRDRFNSLIEEGYTKEEAHKIVTELKGVATFPPASKGPKHHVIYVREDFTKEEIERANIIAVNVIEKGMSICKFCGKSESELEEGCR